MTPLQALSPTPATTAERRKTFRQLHERGCFVIQNPWDVGSARYLAHLGFPALATTSAGFLFSQGRPDSENDDVTSRDRNLAYIADIVAAVDLPVSADFMSGYGPTPEHVADSVTRCIATGVAGLSIEDSTGDPSSPLYDLPVAVERVRAAREAIDRSGEDVLLTARAECYHVGHPNAFRESVRRLQAYVAAGADVLFAPGVSTPTEIEALVAAVAPRPFNLLVVRDIGMGVDEIAALGVRRISVGGALALAAWTGFMKAAKTLKAEGSFAGLANLVPYPEINGLFSLRRDTARGRTPMPSTIPAASPTRLIAGVAVPDTPLIAATIDYAQRLSEPYLFNHAMRSWLFAELVGRAKGIDSTPSLALHKEPEVVVGTMGIGLDYGGFFVDAIQRGDVDRVICAFPRLKMKDEFTKACCRLVAEQPETSQGSFLRDFGERFVPGYKAVSAVDLLMNAPFDE